MDNWRSRRRAGLQPRLLLLGVAVIALGAVLAVKAAESPHRKGHGRTVPPVTVATKNPCHIGPTLAPSCGAYWGAGSTIGWKGFENLIQRKLAIVHVSSPWADFFPTTDEVAAAAQGSLLYVDWNLRDSDVTYAEIAEGETDARINAEAEALKAFGRPIMVSFEAEMDQPILDGNGTPQQFVAAWRHIHDIFAADGAKNVIWVWDITGDVTHGPELPKFYPGDAYVDWIMWDSYNWYGCNPDGSFTWRSFAETVSPMYEWLTVNSDARNGHDYLSKPWGLGEYGTVEGRRPDWKANYFRNIVPSLRSGLPRIRALLYLEADDLTRDRTCRWDVNTSAQSLAAYRAAGHTRYLSTMPFSHDSARLP